MLGHEEHITSAIRNWYDEQLMDSASSSRRGGPSRS
jgi:hypothetical protein